MPCDHELHNLYPEACPGCNAEAYEALLKEAPEGQVTSAEPQETPPAQGTMAGGYSDHY